METNPNFIYYSQEFRDRDKGAEYSSNRKEPAVVSLCTGFYINNI